VHGRSAQQQVHKSRNKLKQKKDIDQEQISIECPTRLELVQILVLENSLVEPKQLQLVVEHSLIVV